MNARIAGLGERHRHERDPRGVPKRRHRFAAPFRPERNPRGSFAGRLVIAAGLDETQQRDDAAQTGDARPTIASEAKRSPDRRATEHSYVAVGIAGSGHVGTIALQECDRRSAGADSAERRR